MPTEDLERGSERVEQQEEEPPQIINGTRSLSSHSMIPCFAISLMSMTWQRN